MPDGQLVTMSLHSHDEALRVTGPIEITDESRIDEICRLRAEVWRATGDAAQGAFPQGEWRDELDDPGGSRHWVILRDDEIVAAARVSVHDRLDAVPEAEEYITAGLRLNGRIAAPARVVVSPAARRYGLASRLLDVQDSAAIEAGAAHGVRQASPGMRRLLIGRGWRDVAPAGADPRFPGVAFQVMMRSYGA